MKRFLLHGIAFPIALFAPFSPRVCGDDRVDFARQILPILSNKCFICHGPDTGEDDTDLRLDSLESATDDRGGYRAIDHNDPEKSEILNRIHSGDDPMPPADAEKQLTGRERELISRWIRQGGQYAKHWAFVPPIKSGSHNSIDGYIAAKLKDNGLEFAQQADPATLARRVALVLTGLPPEPEQLRQFMKQPVAARPAGEDGQASQPDDRAYRDLVEQLLASPRFGEHQARYWLDAVRYGDTHGLHLDNRRGIYPYRDWVVNALNDNLPLDQFITWQLAGDLLPDAELEQQVATGFVRLNPSTGEGGAISEEFQAKNNFDRVETLGTVFLGMTLTCARCHTHKYDPIPQTEYYRLLAFFNSTAEPALDGNSYTYGPTIRVPGNQADWKAWRTVSNSRDELLQRLAAQLSDSDRHSAALEYANSIADFKSQQWKISKPVPVDGNIPSDAKKWSEAKGLPGTISGRAARGKVPTAGQAVWVTANLTASRRQTLWLQFSGGIGTQVFLGDAATPIAEKETDDRTATTAVTLSSGQQWLRLKIVGEPNLSEIEIRVINPWKSLADSKRWDAVSEQDRLLMAADPLGPLAELEFSSRAQDVAQQVRAIQANFTTSLVAKDLPKPRQTRLLKRGEYDKPTGDPLEPGILTVMGEFPQDAPRNRLGLAQWLTSRDHPLVTRVLINRVWQRVFGEALVRSPEDFGLQGQQPTHPELLDWLAVELRESGWDLKHMLRLMVTSQTFRQSSARRGEVNDPENRLLARGPSFRLDAEVLRDLGLWSSGLLDPQMGGEGVKPYQPSGMWLALAHPASNTKLYQQDQGRKLYRRSLYVYWKRTSPHPMMTLFDAPDRESSCVRRSRTSTALQSLGLFNETQRIEMGRCLAERLLHQRDNDTERLTMLFEMLACRRPTESERQSCENLLDAMTKRYSSAESDAAGLLSVGEIPRDESLDVVQHAAWTQVCVTVLASDIAILLY